MSRHKQIGLNLLARIERLELALLYVENGVAAGTREGQKALEAIREEVENANPNRTETK